ncbi:MAG: STAS domain-containing protein [SAR324 cluster bacterium]|nr:STAS domain-containing protein [SAR324 cluster bacterium]
MKYDISENKIKLHNSILLDDIGDLKAIMDEEFSKKSEKWVIDLKEVNSIDTAAIQFLIILKKNLDNQGKNVQFMNLSQSLKKNIELLSLEGFFY